MNKTIGINQYKEEKLDEAFQKNKKLNSEYMAALARLDIKTSNGLAMTDDDILNIGTMMHKMNEGQVETTAALKKYKK